MNIFQKTTSKIILIIIAVLFSGAIWYSPLLFKGYSPDAANDQLILARNLQKTGKYSMYNDRGVLLSSSEVASSGEPSTIGNRLTAGLYSKIIGYIGPMDIAGFVLFSVVVNSLTLLALALLVFYLFGAKIALIFSFIYALLPTNWRTVYALGNYEFALLFLSLFFLLFFFGRERKYNYIFLTVSGFFLSLAVLAKEAFLVALPVIFVYLLLKKKIKILTYTFVPIVIIMSVFYFPKFFGGDNIYKGLVLKTPPEEKLDYSLAGHLYPDYYTFRFDREDFLKQYENAKKGEQGFIKSLMVKKAADNVGADKLSLTQRFVVGSYLLTAHIARFFSLEDTGGAFIFLVGFLGFVYLKRRDLFMSNFLGWWIAGSIILFSYGALAGRNHLMDFSFASALFVALGISYLTHILTRRFYWEGSKKFYMGIIMTFLFGYGLLTVDHVVWGKAYDSGILKIHTYAEIIKQKSIPAGDVVAANIRSDESITLNILTDQSLVLFRPETMEKIIKQGKTKEVFEFFRIKHLLGYSPDLSERLAKISGAGIISDDNVKIIQPGASSSKSFLMNLVR